MRFYQRKATGRIAWQKNSFVASLTLFRDFLVSVLPMRRLPVFIVKFLYGVSPDFIFLVHPRRSEDIYVAVPLLVSIRRFLGKKLFYYTLSFFPPVAISTIETNSKIHGLTITSSLLPEILLTHRKISLRNAIQCVTYCSKILPKNGIIGLGGLWPMVTRRGLALKPYAQKRHIRITNGHCGTLISLYMTIKKIAELVSSKMENMKVAILGVGKMGTNLARMLYGKTAAITLIDINEEKLNRVEETLKKVMSKTDVQKYTNRDDVGKLKDIFADNHIAVCTTSNIRRVLRSDDLPENIIVIDDSRPEAIPRDLASDTCIILEGGLMKIKGIKQNYDFGFGIDENVFGCLAEAFLLAADKSGALHPTLGDVDFSNFDNMLALSNKLGVDVGDLKCLNRHVEPRRIITILNNKSDLLATVPFKNICWLFKVEDLE
jgi:predicted amino acid dehydrogenase